MTSFAVLALEHGLVPESLSRGVVTRRLVEILRGLGYIAGFYHMGRWGWVSPLRSVRCALCRGTVTTGAHVVIVPRFKDMGGKPGATLVCVECIAKGV